MLCGAHGEPFYSKLADHLFGTSGLWDLSICPDARCGLIWLNPMPLKQDILHAYATYYTHAPRTPPRHVLYRMAYSVYGAARDGYLQHRYGYTRGVGRRWRRWLAPLAHLYPGGAAKFSAGVMFLPRPKSGSRLLEIGCGQGELLARMRMLGWVVEGLDIDPEAVRVASAAGLQVRLGELDEQHYPDHYFNAIHLSHVIEHVHDPIGLLNTCHRILKPGGILTMLTPNTDSMGARWFTKNWIGFDPPRHLHLFNMRNITALIDRTRLRRVEISSIARNANHYWSASRSIKHARASDSTVADLSTRPGGLLYQLLERVTCIADPEAGEELLVIACRPESDSSNTHTAI